MEEKPKLTYFPYRGNGEQIRLLLQEAKMDYEFEGIPQEKFHERKQEFEFGQVPCLNIDGKRLVQSHAIMVYLGVKYGFYPLNNESEIYDVNWYHGGIEAQISCPVVQGGRSG